VPAKRYLAMRAATRERMITRYLILLRHFMRWVVVIRVSQNLAGPGSLRTLKILRVDYH
jgi:hypothetical protein